VRWGLSLAVAAVLLVALVVFVDRHNTNGPASVNPKAEARANEEAAVVVSQDQAPHTVRLAAGADPRVAFTHAVRAAMTNLVNRGLIDGPLQRVSCGRHGGGGDTLGFRCTATAQDVNYPFLGVVHLHQRTVVYCKRDAPPVPSMNIPVSRRCEA
jgi:hypothetical protein